MPKTFPAVVFMAAHGRRVAIATALVVTLISLAAVPLGAGWPTVVLGLAVALAAWAAVRLVAELVEVVAETLLPR